VEHVATVRVGRFLSRAEAEIARGVLVANGVPAVVLGDDAGGVHPDISYGYGGVAVGVHPDDVEEAEALLGDIDPPIDRGDLRSPGWRPRARVVVASLLVTLLVVLYLEIFATGVLS
jgi:hypothetical protein